jgi:hypothetical protein
LYVWYVDPNTSQWVVTNNSGGNYLPLTGGSMSGPVGNLTLAADPTVALGAATKQYVDATNIRYRNRIINGDMSVDQRTGFTTTAVTASTTYVADRWKCLTNIAAQKGSAGINATTAPGAMGYTNYLYWNTTAAAYAVASGDFFMLQQFVEGCNFNDAGWGAAGAQPVVLEFWAMSSLIGTFGGSLRNGVNNRSYVFSYTIAVASTWQKFRISIPGDTAGTWAVAATAAALNLTFSVGAGASLSGTPGSWTANNFISATGAVSVVGTLNAVLYLTGVAIMVGAAAANAEPEFRKYSDNLIDCQRYFNPITNMRVAGYSGAAGAQSTQTFLLSPPMRAAPTVAQSGIAYGNASALVITPPAGGASLFTSLTVTAAGTYSATGSLLCDADF